MPRRPNIITRDDVMSGTMYHTYGSEGPSSDIAREALRVNEPVQRSQALYDYSRIDGNGHVSTREGMTRSDYEYFRPFETLPRTPKGIMEASMMIADRNGIVRNVIDMMASFASQGIQIIHPVKSLQKVYRHWFNKVRAPQVSHQFCSILLESGTVAAKRGIARMRPSDVRELQRGFANIDPDTPFEKPLKPKKNEIPIEYTFLNPIHIELAHGELAAFLEHPVHLLRIPQFLIIMIKTKESPTERQLIEDLPAFLRDPIKRGEKYIMLDNDKLSIYHYMKKDWQQWGRPVISPILSDLFLYEKMKLADLAALDGVISRIRLWKLGNVEKGIQPGAPMFQKLHDMLLANVGGGSMDLIWDAAIDLQETGTDVHNFLGETKYKPVLQAIYAGLGIPQSLTGGTAQGAGFTNNAISLKTMIERLQYLRNLLDDFWRNELRIVQEAFGHSQPARIIYDNMTLYDEASEKMIWVQLADRDLVSVESLQERFGMIPEVELMRMKQERKSRVNGRIAQKAGPFHSAEQEHELTKIALQQGTIAPTEAGVKKKPKQKDDLSILDHQDKQNERQFELDKKTHKQALKHKDEVHKTLLPVKKQGLKQKLSQKNKGVPQQGRPKNSKDTKQRDRRSPKPLATASEVLSLARWARESQKLISEVVTPVYLSECKKKNVRSLTVSQAAELEAKKFAVLWNLQPNENVTAESINATIHFPLCNDEGVAVVVELRKAQYGDEDISIEQERELQVSAYTISKGIIDGEVDG